MSITLISEKEQFPCPLRVCITPFTQSHLADKNDYFVFRRSLVQVKISAQFLSFGTRVGFTPSSIVSLCTVVIIMFNVQSLS
jgi:hypothetical protein